MTIDDDPEFEFNDVDPEDEWDDTDGFATRLDILQRILDDVRERRDDRFKLRLAGAIVLVRAMVREHAEDMVRLERIQTALEALEGED